MPNGALSNDLEGIKNRVQELETLIMLNAKIAMQIDLDSLLQTIVDCARELIGARMGGIVVVNPSRTNLLQYFKVSGVSSSDQLPSGHGLFMVPYRTAKPVRVDHVQVTAVTRKQPENHPQLGPFLGVPLKSPDKLLGSLFLAQAPGGSPFTVQDQHLLSAFATQATIAIDSAQARDNLAYLKILEERHRISQGLHSSVAQVLFLLKMEIDRSQKDLANDYPELMERLASMKTLAEKGLYDIKSAIFSLSEPMPATNNLERQLRQMIEGFSRITGINAELATRGAVNAIPEPQAQVLSKVIGESLNNVRKHSQSPMALVSIIVHPTHATLSIQDAGVGLPIDIETYTALPSSRYGVFAMRSLVLQARGSFEIFTNDEGGTTVRVNLPYQETI
ncbi:MAG: histidine kinase [Sulfobacillus benefaciens]|uniref:histidine kinase n=1 Tax=Sulfobacillus benefaciens TaxID=453960 RepID=A0A2T2XE64_9FIRM|nr:MAG: histidine kinase [Sulfobacillus benefaciens]